jgi:hypothetical protein
MRRDRRHKMRGRRFGCDANTRGDFARWESGILIFSADRRRMLSTKDSNETFCRVITGAQMSPGESGPNPS